MFEVTPVTRYCGAEVEIGDDERYRLANSIASYMRYYVNGSISTSKMMDEIDFSRIVTKDGKLTKRISKWVKSESDVKLDDHHLSAIGAIIGHYNPSDFTYDITDTFDWRAGDFGDGGSCFWGGRSEAKDWIQDAGGLALRFYEGDEVDMYGYRKGNGRCWLMPKDDKWIAFNAYGPDLDSIQRRIEVIRPGLHLRMVGLENYGETSGTLWINNDSGLLISEKHVSIHSIDLEVGDVSHCQWCNNHYSGDDYYIESLGYSVCESCYQDSFGRCRVCEEVYDNDSLANVEYLYRAGSWIRSYEYVCESCMEDLFACERCGCYAGTRYQSDVEEVCKPCYKEHYQECKACGNHNYKGDECECQPAIEESAETESVAVTETTAILGNSLYQRLVTRLQERGRYRESEQGYYQNIVEQAMITNYSLVIGSYTVMLREQDYALQDLVVFPDWEIVVA